MGRDPPAVGGGGAHRGAHDPLHGGGRPARRRTAHRERRSRGGAGHARGAEARAARRLRAGLAHRARPGRRPRRRRRASRASATSSSRHPVSAARSPRAPTTPRRRSARSSRRSTPPASATARSRHPTPPSTTCTSTSSATPSTTPRRHPSSRQEQQHDRHHPHHRSGRCAPDGSPRPAGAAALAHLDVASGVGTRHVARAAPHLDPAVRLGVLVARRAAAVRRRGLHRLPGPRHPHDDRAVLRRVGGHRLHRRHQFGRHGPVPHLADLAHGDHLRPARPAAHHQRRPVARRARHRLARPAPATRAESAGCWSPR